MKTPIDIQDCKRIFIVAAALALAGCDAPRVSAPAPAPSGFREKYYDVQDRLAACQSQRDVLDAETRKQPGRRHVRMTADEAKRFDGQRYATLIDGVRCWPDNAEWMWCEAPEKPPSDCTFTVPPGLIYRNNTLDLGTTTP